MAMNRRTKRLDVMAAAEDLRRRTLSQLPRALDRLIYLASMRDYNSGVYQHAGLAARFSEEASCEALADCHREAFRELLGCSLREVVRQLEGYFEASQTSLKKFLSAWKELEPYRIAIPAETEPIIAEFFVSNIRIALAIVENQRRAPRAQNEFALPPR
jgi:hypothetical protein